MKVKDRNTGLILESKDEFVISQWEKKAERYEPVKGNTSKSSGVVKSEETAKE